jgi:hypothetical protein
MADKAQPRFGLREWCPGPHVVVDKPIQEYVTESSEGNRPTNPIIDGTVLVDQMSRT